MFRTHVRFCLSIAGSFLLLATSANSQTLNAGTYDGWVWDEVGNPSGTDYFAEQCSSALTFVIDGANNFTISGSDESCRGRQTSVTGNNLFFFPPETFSDTGTQPLIHRASNLGSASSELLRCASP